MSIPKNMDTLPKNPDAQLTFDSVRMISFRTLNCSKNNPLTTTLRVVISKTQEKK